MTGVALFDAFGRGVLAVYRYSEPALKEAYTGLRFVAWLLQLRWVASPHVGLIPGYYAPEAWRGYFEDGYSPQAAFDEERTYWESA